MLQKNKVGKKFMIDFRRTLDSRTHFLLKSVTEKLLRKEGINICIIYQTTDIVDIFMYI